MSQAAVLSPAPLAAPAVNKWFVAVAVSIGALMEIIDTSIVNVALTDMQASLGATLSQTSWIVSSYGIANVIVLPLSAWLGHRFGKKRYFMFSLVGFLVASILCGMSTSLPMLVIARVLQGLTGGGLLAKAQSILFETFPREEQGLAQAFFGAIVIAGPAIGPTLGDYIVTNIGWRWIFFINLPVGIVAIFLVVAALPADGPRPLRMAPIDWLAIGLLAVVCAFFGYGIVSAGSESESLALQLIKLQKTAKDERRMESATNNSGLKPEMVRAQVMNQFTNHVASAAGSAGVKLSQLQFDPTPTKIVSKTETPATGKKPGAWAPFGPMPPSVHEYSYSPEG